MGAHFCGCSGCSNNTSKTETNNLSNSIYVNNNSNIFINLEYNKNSKNGTNLIYNKKHYDTLPLIEKITIKNKVNKIETAYKSHLLRKIVRYLKYFYL